MRNIVEINRSAWYALIFLHYTFEELGCCQSQDFRADNVENCANHRSDKYNQQEVFLWLKIAKKPVEGASKVLCFLYRHPYHTHWASSYRAHRALILPGNSQVCALLTH